MAQKIVNILRARRAMAKASGLRVRRGRVPKLQPPTGARLRYQALLTGMRKTLAEILRDELLPALPWLVDQAARERGGLRTDATVEELQTLFARLRLLFVRVHPPAETTIAVQGVATETDRIQALGHQRQMKAALGVEVIIPEPWRQAVIKDFVAENQGLVTSLVDGELDIFKKITSGGIRSGLRVGGIAKQLEDRLDITKSKAALLARDQTLRLFGEITELRQRNVGVEEYIWDTSKDERVRPRHKDLEGTKQKWSEPPIVDPKTGRRAHPGGDYQCRCLALPILPDDYLSA